MAELSRRTAAPGLVLERRGFLLGEASDIGLVHLRGFSRDPDARAAIAGALGLESLPEQGQCAQVVGLACYALPPLELLWLAPREQCAALLGQLESALGNQLVALHDETPGHVLFELQGARRWELLSRGATLDFERWSEAATGAVALKLAGVPVTLLRAADGALTLLACRSLATYLHGWFAAVSRDCT